MSNVDPQIIDTAIVGEPTDLYVETDEALQSDVTVQFRAQFTDDKGAAGLKEWQEQLTAASTTPHEPLTGKPAFLIKWRANYPGNQKDLTFSPVLRFIVQGRGAGGNQVIGPSQHLIVLRPAIAITTNPGLTRIMLHEFAKLSGVAPSQTVVFDPGPLQQFLDGLSFEQKKLLVNYDPGSSGNRLVIFVSIYPATDARRMGADLTQESTPAIANAQFSVFHCQGPGKVVALVCHTAHFLVNMRNGDTQKLINGPQDGRPASDWQSKTVTKPVRFMIASVLPQQFTHGVIYSRIFTATGKDVMKGNTMHGMINTVGCWMLFQNFNWPRAKFNDFDAVYRLTYRPMAQAGSVNWNQVRSRLAALGYDANQRDLALGLSSSLEKFLNFDRNYAFLWFFHDLVGIKYFSSGFEGWAYFNDRTSAEGEVRFANDFHTSGLQFEKTFPLARASDPPFNIKPDEAGFQAFDPVIRRKTDPHFSTDDSLLTTNILGFQTATRFTPQNRGVFADVSVAELAACSWADLYIFREPSTPPLP